jgi:proteasome lid subunit RPN8/RPN11
MKSKTVTVRTQAQPAVVMEAEVARKIRQHSRSSMKAEVCGVLIGSTEKERTLVEASIPGINAAQGGAHVTFTQDTWEHIYRIKDQQYPDEKIVGWYHSHPGFGVFLSEHDLFIQENFFSSPQQIAWVYDPQTDEEGCFGWVGGKTQKLSGMRFLYSQSVEGQSAEVESFQDGPSEEAADDGLASQVTFPAKAERSEPAWVTLAIRSLGYIAVLGLGFVAGYQFLLYRLGPTLGACQQVVEHPLEACQQLYQQFMPGVAGPGLRPAQNPHESQPARMPPGTSAKGSDGKH